MKNSLIRKLHGSVMLLLVFLLAACAAPASPGTAPAGDAASGDAATEAAAEAQAPAGEPIEVSFMGWGSEEERQIYQEAFDLFKEQTGISVNYIYVPQDYDTKFKTMVAGDEVPDVFYVPENEVINYAATGKLLNLDPYIETNPEVVNDFVPGLLEFGQLEDGSQYAIPKGWEPFLVFINVDMFNEAGVPVPDGSWTFDEFREVARQMTVPGDAQSARYGLALDTWWGPWMTFIGNAGGEFFADGQSKFDDPNVIAGLQYMVDLALVDKSAPSPAVLQQTGMGSSQMFQTGRVAMYPTGRWVTPTYRDSLDFTWDAVEMPIGERRVNPIFSGMLAIGANSEHPDAAFQLLQFLMGKEGQLGVTGMGLQMPPYQAQMDDPDLVNEPPSLGPSKATAVYHGYDSQLNTARSGKFGEYVNRIVQPQLDAVFTGDKTVEEAVVAIDEQANAELFSGQ
jgi:multiple sugar transport system substrate-binding protein